MLYTIDVIFWFRRC